MSMECKKCGMELSDDKIGRHEEVCERCSDILDDVIGCVINDNALTDQKSERLYYDEDDFGELTTKIAKTVFEWLTKED